METDKYSRDNDLEFEKSIILPVIEEQVLIEKQLKETGRVRIEKQVSEKKEMISSSLSHDEHIIEHVSKNEYVDTIPVMRQEGNTMIIPVLQEVLVKRILLVEEIRITKHVVQTNEQQEVALRKENVRVERVQ